MSQRKRQVPLSPSMRRAFQSFAVNSDGSAVATSSHPYDDERFYAFVRVCHRLRRRLSEAQVSQLLCGVGFPKDEADECGSLFTTAMACYRRRSRSTRSLASATRSFVASGNHIGSASHGDAGGPRVALLAPAGDRGRYGANTDDRR